MYKDGHYSSAKRQSPLRLAAVILDSFQSDHRGCSCPGLTGPKLNIGSFSNYHSHIPRGSAYLCNHIISVLCLYFPFQSAVFFLFAMWSRINVTLIMEFFFKDSSWAHFLCHKNLPFDQNRDLDTLISHGWKATPSSRGHLIVKVYWGLGRITKNVMVFRCSYRKQTCNQITGTFI